MTTLQDVISFIASQATRDDLDVVYDVSKQRRKALSAVNLAVFGPGDRIRTRNLSPKYLSGLVGVVVRRDGQRLVVDLDEGQYTGKYGSKNLPRAGRSIGGRMITDIFRLHNLVLTATYSPHEGYEILVEVDADEDATGVTVNIGNAVGDEVEWVL